MQAAVFLSFRIVLVSLTNDRKSISLKVRPGIKMNARNASGITSLLSAEGYRLTPGRRRVIETILAVHGLFSIVDIVRLAPGIGRATVFRAVRLLVELRLVCRVRLEDGNVRYRLSASDHHHHLVCTGCGSVEDFPDCDLDGLSKSVAVRTKYQIQGHRLELYGLCPACISARPGGAVR